MILIRVVGKQALVAKQAARTGRVVSIVMMSTVISVNRHCGTAPQIMFEIEYEVKNEKYQGLEDHPRLRNHFCRAFCPPGSLREWWANSECWLLTDGGWWDIAECETLSVFISKDSDSGYACSRRTVAVSNSSYPTIISITPDHSCIAYDITCYASHEFGLVELEVPRCQCFIAPCAQKCA